MQPLEIVPACPDRWPLHPAGPSVPPRRARPLELGSTDILDFSPATHA
jgi:hypothetical protein